MTLPPGRGPMPQFMPGKQPELAKYIIAVGSGKGGVGKSTISLNLSLALARQGAVVGLLDADFQGPDIPLMVGLTRMSPSRNWPLWRHPAVGEVRLEPLERFGVKIMSVGFLLAEKQHVFSWGPLLQYIGYQLLWQVNWGDPDYLIVDLPPGAADLHQHLLRFLPLSGAIIVVGPQDVAHLDAKKLVEMLKEVRVRILGGVENMSGVLCPECGKQFDVFPRVREDRSIWSLGVPLLGRVPLHPAVAEAGDRGEPVMVSQLYTPQARAFQDLASVVVGQLRSAGDGDAASGEP